MNSYDLRNLQEAYLDVYEGKVSWDDPKNPNPSGYTPKEKSKAKREQLGVDNPDTKSFEAGGPSEDEYARYANLVATQEKMKKRSNQPKGKPHQFKKNPFWKRTLGQVRREIFGTEVPKNKRSSYVSSKEGGPFFAKEEVDLYDLILSHLLDEGYAETPEAAEVMMVNMSEEWRESIVEAKKSLPVRKMKTKENKLFDDDKLMQALRTPVNSPERKERMKDLQRLDIINSVRTSFAKRGGKEPHPMPEVGRFKPKDED